MRTRHNTWMKEGVPQDSCWIRHTIHFAVLKLERTGNWKQSRQGYTALLSRVLPMSLFAVPSALLFTDKDDGKAKWLARRWQSWDESTAMAGLQSCTTPPTPYWFVISITYAQANKAEVCNKEPSILLLQLREPTGLMFYQWVRLIPPPPTISGFIQGKATLSSIWYRGRSFGYDSSLAAVTIIGFILAHHFENKS